MSKSNQNPSSWREGRRLRAWALHEQGWKQNKIAAALGVTEGAVSQWLKRGRADGVEALRDQPKSGAPRRLSREDLARLPALLSQGPEAHGFRGAVWTRRRVAQVIEQVFGVQYHPDHVGRLLDEIGWTVQQPLHRASQRDAAAIAQWQDEHWPALEKKAVAEERTLVWVDESGFYLLPARVRTYAPRGQTPILHAPLAYDHLSVISAITPQGRLLMQVQPRA